MAKPTPVEEALDVVRLLRDTEDALTEASTNIARAQGRLDELDNIPGALVYLLAAMQEKMPPLRNAAPAAVTRMEIVAGKEPMPKK